MKVLQCNRVWYLLVSIRIGVWDDGFWDYALGLALCKMLTIGVRGGDWVLHMADLILCCTDIQYISRLERIFVVPRFAP